MSESMVQFLKNKFFESKKFNSSLSIRSFAVKAGISSGAMSDIFNGKRQLTRNMAEKIAINLKMNPTERSLFLNASSEREVLGIKKIRFFSRAQFQHITDASYFSLLSLMETKSFKYDIDWIADRLEITPEKVSSIIRRFKDLNVLTEIDGKLVRANDVFSTSDDISDSLVKASHLETLRAAHKSLNEVDVNLRDFTSFCFPADPALMNEVKQRIRVFQDEIALLMRTKNSNEVYKLAIHLFPQTKPLSMTKKEENNEKKIKNF